MPNSIDTLKSLLTVVQRMQDAATDLPLMRDILNQGATAAAIANAQAVIGEHAPSELEGMTSVANILYTALDGASAVVDPGEGESFAYQDELEMAAKALGIVRGLPELPQNAG